MHVSARVGFQSSLPLESVAERVSASLLGGIPFVGKQEFLRDEVPAVRSAGHVFGLKAVLQGGPGDGYLLEVYPADPTDDAFRVESFEDEVDLSSLLATLLGRVPGVISVDEVSTK